jgi:hypothetical protein
MNRYRIFLVQTSTLPPSLWIYQTWKVLYTKQPSPSKSHVELEDCIKWSSCILASFWCLHCKAWPEDWGQESCDIGKACLNIGTFWMWATPCPGEFPVDCPLQDSVMRVHYKASLPDEGGRVFLDTKENGGEPIEFASGEGVVSGPVLP